MTHRATTYPVRLGFLPRSYAIPDLEHPGLLRAGDRATAPYGGESVEVHECPARDSHNHDGPDAGLLGMGFDTVDIAPFDDLQSVLARIRETGKVTDPDVAAVRSGLDGVALSCASGLTLKVLHLAGEGLFMRTAGPNRMPVVPPRTSGVNDHGPATSVHADQDVFGTPVRQLMDGRAPTLFRHDSPGAHNHEPSLMLVNLWIPLQQITQPLVIADGRSIDRQRHQLRYGLATDSFLEREDDMAINDIWTFLHDPGQRWYFRSEMDHRSAFVFDTLSTAHSAGVLPGEDVAERCYRALEAAESAIELGDGQRLAVELADVDAIPLVVETTPALGQAIDRMVALIDEALADPQMVCGPMSHDWTARSRAARRSVVRMSIELRMVVSVERGVASYS